MSYIPTENVEEGDVVTITVLNQIKDNINAAFSILGTNAINVGSPLNAEHSTHYLHTEGSGLGILHKFRWLGFGSTGKIVDPAGIEDDITLTDPDTGLGFFDLEGVAWLGYGMYYLVEGVTWAQEFDIKV